MADTLDHLQQDISKVHSCPVSGIVALEDCCIAARSRGSHDDALQVDHVVLVFVC